MREMPGVHIDQNRCSHKSECADCFVFFIFFDDAASCHLLFEHGKPEDIENDFKNYSLEDSWVYVLGFFHCSNRVHSSR